MRLLHPTTDGFTFTRNPEEDMPEYAVLSHTWLSDDEEVHYDDLIEETGRLNKQGYAKIRFCGEQAAKDGLQFFWVDTCCINKGSSQEVAEAVTCMYQWYRNAAKCYVYMSDVSTTEQEGESKSSPPPWEEAFRNSRWFTRGWTLQELLAPTCVEFYSREGNYLGSKASLQQLIFEITGIPLEALEGRPLANFPVSERLSWAEHRNTTRREDKAYSLLGIFAVFMPLVYGEGDHAFIRLLEELDKKSEDDTKLDKVLDYLPTSPSAAFNSLENHYGPTCLPNTRVEILEDITKWPDGSDERCIFWMSGGAGTGKSTIARTIARQYHDRGNLGGSFFFSRGGGSAGRAEQLFTTLASQLAGKIPAAKRHVCEAIMRHKDIADQSLREQWDKLIIDPLSKLENGSCPPAIVLVLDALDECENERDARMILWLLALNRTVKACRLRILITSRPETQIRAGFQQIPEAERRGFVLDDISELLVNRDLTLFFEENFNCMRKERGLPATWPGVHVVARLVQISSGLFIWASTACRYIREGGTFAMERVSKLINGALSGAGPQKQLDQIYTTVLREAISEDYDDEEKTEFKKILRTVLGSLVLLSSNLSTESLASLLEIEIGMVTETLADLHTIFAIPSDNTRPIRLRHPSFRDFLLDNNRCKDQDFWIDGRETCKALADNCDNVMSRMLKANICGLQSPGTYAKDIDYDQLQRHIPAELRYACLYWAEHYWQSGTRLRDDDHVHRLFDEHLLHWLEAASLTSPRVKVAATVRIYQSLLQPRQNRRQLPFVQATRRLVQFQSQIEYAPLQIYCAVLAYIRPSNLLRQHFWGQMHPWLKQVRILEADAPETKDEYDSVNDLAFTPDGRLLASGSVDPWVRIWDVETKATVARYKGQTQKISSIAISPDGTMLASGSDDATIVVWDMHSNDVRHCLKGHANWVNAVAFSPDCKLLASGSMDETVRLWDAVSGKEIGVLESKMSCVNSIAFSPDGSLIASGTVDQVIPVWDRSKGAVSMVFEGHLGPVNSVQFSHDGALIASGSDDGTVRLWSTKTGSQTMNLQGHAKKVWTVAFSRDSRLIASGSSDKTVKLWNAATGDIVATLVGQASGLNAVAFAPDGQHLASSSFNGNVRLWDIKTGEMKGGFAGFDLDNELQLITRLEAMDMDETLDDPFSDAHVVPEEVAKGHTAVITSLVFSHDGQLVASASADARIKLWTSDGTHQGTLEGHSGGINQLAFSPSDRLLASASVDGTTNLWDPTSGALLHTLRGHSDTVRQVYFSPDGALLASCSADRSIKLWDTATGAALNTLIGHADTVNAAAFSPDSLFIASCSADRMICLWNTTTGNRIFGPIRAHDDSVDFVAFSPDGRLLVSCSSDSQIKIWNAKGEARATLTGHTLPVTSAAFSSDAKRLVSCSADETVRVWDLEAQSAPRVLHVGVAMHSVAFAACGEYIETDRGLLKIDTSSAGLPIGSSEQVSEVFVAREWVRRGGEGILWLPEEYRAVRCAVRGETSVLGHASGAISFVRV